MRKDSLDGECFDIVVGAGMSGIGIQHRLRSGHPDTSLPAGLTAVLPASSHGEFRG